MLSQPSDAQRRLRRRLAPLLTHAAQTPDADRYRKRFPALAHLWVLVLHGLLPTASLRQTSALLQQVPAWWRQWGMTAPLSFSQLARSSTSRPPACFEQLLTDLTARLQHCGAASPEGRLLGQVQALDSTFLRLSAALAPWSQPTRFAPGLRLQLRLLLASRTPAGPQLTSTQVNDHQALWETDLREVAGWTLLFDLGYYGHRQLERLRDGGVSFLTRLQGQAHYRVTASHPVPREPTEDGDWIVADQTITLGSPNNRRGAVLEELRLVTSRNPAGTEYAFVTDRFDLSAHEVVWLYRKRWRIELFFRWLKQELALTRPLGTSPQAIWLTVLVTLIVALALQLLTGVEQGQPSRATVTQLHVTLMGWLLAPD